MYKVLSIEISGFWGKYNATGRFNDEVNIIIGKNGSGKTTFINILHAVLSVDLDMLYEVDFHTATIKLHDGNRLRTIKAEKQDFDGSPFPILEYQLSTKKYSMPIIGVDDRSQPLSIRRRAHEEAQKVKEELEKLISLASLSVYRVGKEEERDGRDRPARTIMSPVDVRLAALMQRLTHYQLELSNQARTVSSRLQRDVLISLLYQKGASQRSISIETFEEAKEKQNLISAYKQLGVSGIDITKRINEHATAVSETVNAIKNYKDKDLTELNIDFAPLEARRRTEGVINMSLEAEGEINKIFSPIQNFLKKINEFIPEKRVSFKGGDLTIEQDGEIGVSKLSSGEKQLLILFIESLLQRQSPYVFLADEPELSLHISWQRKIISAIREINPLAQVIVATHSPEIAGGFRNCIIDMEDMLHG